MINLAWGGYANGRLPQSALVQVSSKPDYLEYNAARQWLAMRQACYNATGRWINIAPGSSAYRDYPQQQFFYGLYLKGGNVAAVPGTSNHGWGRAVDLTGYESYPAVWAWLLANAGSYGYSWQTGKASGERWHWESLNTPSNPASGTAGGGAIPLPVVKKRKLDMRVIKVVQPSGTTYALIGTRFFQSTHDVNQANAWAELWGDAIVVSNTAWDQAQNVAKL